MSDGPGLDVLEVLDPGLLTTIQDGGRPGLAGEGITRGGAADTWSLAVANALVGNPATGAALEVTLIGPTVRALRPVTIGLAGALEAVVTETGDPVRPGSAVTLRAGWTLAFGPPADGVRGYLALPGGVAVPPVLGSRSTVLGAGFGGLEGRALRTGDRIAAAAPAGRLTPPAARWPGAAVAPSRDVRLLPGPHAAELGPAALDALVATPWTVALASDRVGLRLDGPTLPGPWTGELASHGVLAGAIQVPPDGRPIVLLADHQPTGGYPVVAVVVAADIPRLGQLAPGLPVRFALVSLEEARAALRDAAASFAASLAHLRDAAAWDDLWHGAGG